LKHFASSRFWAAYEALPKEVRACQEELPPAEAAASSPLAASQTYRQAIPDRRPVSKAVVHMTNLSGYSGNPLAKKLGIAARVPTDVTEDTIRDVCLPLGFVDIKVCAVSNIWSGLKLMIRKELR
jgi:hypothetical protein